MAAANAAARAAGASLMVPYAVPVDDTGDGDDRGSGGGGSGDNADLNPMALTLRCGVASARAALLRELSATVRDGAADGGRLALLSLCCGDARLTVLLLRPVLGPKPKLKLKVRGK